MALFAPTNITPSSTGPRGSGTVDVNNGITVSWQVNGSSAMEAFRVVIYANDAKSTKKFDTGKLTNGCPFYGTDYKGDIQMFSYKIPASSLTNVTNGSDYKLIITQYWEGGNSIAQPSASAFSARETPKLEMDTVPFTIRRRDSLFIARFNQGVSGKDSIEWVRWQLKYESETDGDKMLRDTGNIYGTGDIKFYYDGFLTGKSYAVRCLARTVNGFEISTGWNYFDVIYSQKTFDTKAVAEKAEGDRSAVHVSWRDFYYIYGTPHGKYSISGNTLILPSESYVRWDSVTGDPMEIASPWSVISKSRLKKESVTLLEVSHLSGGTKVEYDSKVGELKLRTNKLIAEFPGVNGDATVTTVITPNHVYFRVEQMGGGLNPSETTYPSESLYPADDFREEVLLFDKDLTSIYQQANVRAIVLRGAQTNYYTQLLSGSASQEIIDSAYRDGEYTPANQDGTQFQADYKNSLNAGGFFIGGAELTGWAVYRQKENEVYLDYVTKLPLNANGFYDYGVRSCQGRYSYYIFPESKDAYITKPVVTNQINPRFWNWTILEATGGEDGRYTVVAEYAFGKNLGTSATSNNNTPGIMQNFTRYPTIQRSPLNYKTGSLTSLIGVIDTLHNCEYYDTIELRDAIESLSTTQNTLFLKSRKGDLFPIAISAPITMQTMDNWKEQAQEAMIPWVQVGSGDGVSLVSAEKIPMLEPKKNPYGVVYDEGDGNLFVDSDYVDARYNPVDESLTVDSCAAHTTDDGDGNLTWWWWSDT